MTSVRSTLDRFTLDADTTGAHVLAGTGVTVVFSFLPFSPLAGGAVAAHRRGGGYLAGLWLGTLAGLAGAVVLGVMFVPALAMAQRLGFGMAPGSPGYELYLQILALLYLLYTVGLSALGGVLGSWTARHTDWPLDPADWL